MSTMTDIRPASSVPPAGPPPRRGRAAALIIGGVLTFAFVGWSILTLVTLTAWQSADGSRSFAGQVKRVVVHSSAGGVTITGTRPTGGRSATASWHSRWSFFHPSVHASLAADGTLTVTTSCRQNWVPIGCNVRLGVGAPPNVPITVSSSGGGVTASHFTNGLVINSSGGGISLNDVTGPLTLDSSGGGIHGVLHSSTVNADSSGGGINLTFSEPPQGVRVRSSGGGVRIALPQVSGDYRIRASSSGGSVHVDIPNNDQSSRLVDVSSSGGGVRVTRPTG